VRVAKESLVFDEGVVDLRGERITIAPKFPAEVIKDEVRHSHTYLYLSIYIYIYIYTYI